MTRVTGNAHFTERIAFVAGAARPVHRAGSVHSVVRGSNPDNPFDVTVPVREKFEIELDEPDVIDEAHRNPNVTIVLNPPQWLVINGVVVDPERFLSERGLRERFRTRARAALRAFEDGNRNGEDDRDTDSDRD